MILAWPFVALTLSSPSEIEESLTFSLVFAEKLSARRENGPTRFEVNGSVRATFGAIHSR